MWPTRYGLPGVLESLNLPPPITSGGEDAQPCPSRRDHETVTLSEVTSDASDAETAARNPSPLPLPQDSETHGDPTPEPQLKSGSDSDSTISAAHVPATGAEPSEPVCKVASQVCSSTFPRDISLTCISRQTSPILLQRLCRGRQDYLGGRVNNQV